mmetsp:Transcript_6068/g.16162  ORF Transcript_6068/g.16162 Transcript_6068/m.16162 type:complete len:359 (+) Transcript_6068:103-1179(+)|eukprot:CAMPEP_0202358684 /NCGR_PEP_ID=MMETSP1126-20121109/12270_1 /ASSEMBLY_ACC=CAM_ASM_000457 /TAXON_ID=3047 /ORGANISM="Dunaliella tertiolecta, Strain CCMP1320" /LENGTH=358 /DNA_ID=CAMNT_0048951929 /DNA_START=43 /DNA_END=1119 /DNA_ORIENTATION=+
MPRAILCVANGDPSLPLGAGVLELSPNHPSPSPKPGYLKILVSASSVNFADPLTVEGKYQVKIPTPFVPGSEASGTVVEVGHPESSFKPGDKVVSFHQGGAYADEMLVPELTTWKVPQGVDLTTSAAVPVVYGTADLALRHRAGLKQGQTVLVLGAGGGVGLAAVQISKVLGAKVIAVTQGAAKVAFLQSQGADVVIDLAHTSKDRPLSILVKQHVPKGVNVVIDPVGGVLFNEALRCVAWGAHIVVIGFAAGGIPKIPANILLVKNTTVHGLYWGSYLQHQPAVLRSSMDILMQWLSEGKLHPHVSHTFKLEDLPTAFATLLQRKAMGKVLVLGAAGEATAAGHAAGAAAAQQRSRL